ncbi:hypothetical protein KDW_38650 [Dictyobacter vulcani]|uniref:Uncharacterized protein n=1 Tax=Dictyobacter vulcani TaxID=2607529 RepID=A0A5J4KQ34_9CHLR|nr:hypothetical protein [Dictyobacter vulcani]GER89703.1 hypothetical protein KDW_38650 [Dictyobacter vulcani]
MILPFSFQYAQEAHIHPTLGETVGAETESQTSSDGIVKTDSEQDSDEG